MIKFLPKVAEFGTLEATLATVAAASLATLTIPPTTRLAPGTCAYYQYLQGTSMAAPHAVGVAALIVSKFGVSDGRRGLTLSPNDTRRRLLRTATDHPCPVPPILDYSNVGRPASYNATCVGTTEKNNIWGEGIVDALAAVQDH